MRKHPYTPPRNTSGVYKIVNLVNGKIYVGSSQDMQLRWQQHRAMLNKQRHHSKRLQYAWNKYGHEAFVFEILELTPIEMCIDREQFWIDTLHPFYNSYPFAIALRGLKRTPEIRAKISDSRKGSIPWMKGKHHTDEARRKLSEVHKGKPSPLRGIPLLEETRTKISISKRGVPQPNRKRGYKIPYKPRPYQSERQKGVKHTPERIAKNRASHIGKKASEETRAKMSAMHKGRARTNESVEKTRLALIGRKKSPDHRARLAEAYRGKKLSEKTKANMSIAQKARREAIKNTPQEIERINRLKQLRKGAHHTEESKAKLREKRLGTKASEETRVKLRNIHKAAYEAKTQEERQRNERVLAEARQKRWNLYRQRQGAKVAMLLTPQEEPTAINPSEYRLRSLWDEELG